VRRRILSTSFLILLVALPLIPPLFGVPSATPAVASGGPVVPADNDLNATDPIIAYEYYTPDTPYGNSSLLNVTVEEVVASDIGVCRDGDLDEHSFGVYFDENNSIVFEDDLQYIDGTGWAALNYSLFPSNLNYSVYKVRCRFERNASGDIWTETTGWSTSFDYQHYLTIGDPDFTYIGDTSDTIDVWVEYIASTVWGTLTQVSNNTLGFEEADAPTNVTEFHFVLQYNITSTYWEVHELNISTLIPNESYRIVVSANYSIRLPQQYGTSAKSDAFTFKGPYIRIARPIISYIGRDVQTLNITVSWVWHSIFGNLTDTDLSIQNFSIYLLGDATAAVNTTLNWNGVGSYWFVENLNISYYIEQGSLSIGEYYQVSTFFHSIGASNRTAVNATSLFSESFLIDRDPPNVALSVTNPYPASDTDFVEVTGEITDDALIHTAICSYLNPIQSIWINITMRGTRSKLANYTATIPPFPEQELVQYRIYVNDTQDAWFTSTTFSYTVADRAPAISFVSFLPANPTDENTVTVNATVIDGSGVSSVQLYYSFDGINFLSPLEMVHISDSIYQAVIPSYPLRMPNYQFESAYFYINATDTLDNTGGTTTFAYIIQGSLIGLDPALSLLLLSAVALVVVVLIVLFKIYERY